MYDMIDEIRKRSRVFIISHRLLDCIAVADHVIRMENLNIAEHFPIEQIIEKDHILNYYSFENEVRNV